MSLNVNKTILISFHRRRNFSTPEYTINNCPISLSDSFKYLGVNISHDLTWANHVNQITNSANRVLGYIRRNLTLAPSSVKLLAYNTLVRPKLEYASAIYDPFQLNLIKTLEAVQNQATRFILSDYSYNSSITALKSQLDLPALAHRRRNSRLNLYHKFFHCLPPKNELIVPVHRMSRNTHPNAVIPPRAHTTTFHQSFFIRTARDWNRLPGHIATITDHAAFKSAVEEIAHIDANP